MSNLSTISNNIQQSDNTMENKTLEQLQEDLAHAKSRYKILNRPALSDSHATAMLSARIQSIQNQINMLLYSLQQEQEQEQNNK